MQEAIRAVQSGCQKYPNLWDVGMITQEGQWAEYLTAGLSWEDGAVAAETSSYIMMLKGRKE